MATPGKLSRLVYRCLALACIGLGAIGAVLPLLPTTPFLLVAAWAAPKGSPRLAAWLWEHPYLSPPLVAWRDQRAVPRRAKWLACGCEVFTTGALFTNTFGTRKVFAMTCS